MPRRMSQQVTAILTFSVNALNLMSLKAVPQLARELGINAVKLSWTMLPETHRVHSIFKRQDTVNDLIRNVSAEQAQTAVEP